MYTIAIIGDLLSLVPFLNIVTSPLTGLALSMVGSGKMSLFSGDAIGATLLTAGVEMVPGVSTIPAWTVRVWWAKRQAAASGAGSEE